MELFSFSQNIPNNILKKITSDAIITFRKGSKS